MRSLYVTLTPREKGLGFCLLALYLLVPGSFWWSFMIFAASLFLFRRFLVESRSIPLTPLPRILLKAALGVMAAQLVNLLVNDLFYPFYPQYFIYGDTGPAFHNVHKAALSAAAVDQFLPLFLRAVIFVPVAEELLYRGVLFGTLHNKWGWPAYLVTSVLYALVFTAPLVGAYPISFVAIHFLQTLPLSLFFGWIYTSTDTIFTPILAHIVLNAVSVLPMR